LIFTGRNYGVARRQLEVSQRTLEVSQQTMTLAERSQRRTLELTEQGQVTDRYTKAIEQLGSDKLDVRIGGIYAMERIAHDSPKDHPTVMEVLCAFIREHSWEPWPLTEPDEGTSVPSTRPDVQAALTAIKRRDPEQDRAGAKLAFADLSGADLQKAVLANADLALTNLNAATLTEANLVGAKLPGTNLRSAECYGANLARHSSTGHISRVPVFTW
jgi:hypothetical protein